MAKNSREGNQSRKKRYYEALAERGIRPVQVLAPESAHPLIRQAATLMTRDEAPLEPRAALRRAGGANEPEPGEASPGLAAELEAAKARIAEIERQAEARLAIVIEAAERRRLALEKEAQKAVKAVQDAEGRAAAALQRAEKAEATIQQAKAMPGLKGRLIRLLAGDVLK